MAIFAVLRRKENRTSDTGNFETDKNDLYTYKFYDYGHDQSVENLTSFFFTG